MLRLRLGVDDLVRLRFAAPTPYCQLAVSAQSLQQPASPFGRLWRSRRQHVPAIATRLLALIPRYGSVPEFLAPERCTSLDDELDLVQSTPPPRIRTELAELPGSSGSAAWLGDLASGRVDALKKLGGAMRAYHDLVLAPMWPAIEEAVAAELARRTWQLATQGVEATLNALHPQIRWHDGAVQVDSDVDADIDLGGRGLRLVPSIWSRPGVAVGWTEPTLDYPLSLLDRNPAYAAADRFAAALGATRARVLCTLTGEHTTTELARALGISTSSASMHASALRDAKLVATRRDGQAVRHVMTDLARTMVATTATAAGRSGLL